MEDLFGIHNASNNNNNQSSSRNNSSDIHRQTKTTPDDNQTNTSQQLHARIHRRAQQPMATVTRPTVNGIDKFENDIEEVLL